MALVIDNREKPVLKDKGRSPLDIVSWTHLHLGKNKSKEVKNRVNRESSE